jgi:general secretion pathway protein G
VGFTLLEPLGVLVILALIAGLAAPRVMKLLGDVKTKTARINLEQFSTVPNMGRYPDAD